MPLYSLKYKDVHGVEKYYMDIGFESEESANKERERLYRVREKYQLRGINLDHFLSNSLRVPLSFYDFEIVERKLKNR